MLFAHFKVRSSELFPQGSSRLTLTVTSTGPKVCWFSLCEQTLCGVVRQLVLRGQSDGCAQQTLIQLQRHA